MAASAPETIDCDVGAAEPDAVTVDTLARFELAARRRGCLALFSNASSELLELVAFMGLDDVLRLEPVGQTEERE